MPRKATATSRRRRSVSFIAKMSAARQRGEARGAPCVRGRSARTPCRASGEKSARRGKINTRYYTALYIIYYYIIHYILFTVLYDVT